MLLVREDIPSNIVEAEANPIEGFYIELNLVPIVYTKTILETTSRH